MRIRKYYALLRNSFREASAFRLDALTTFFSSIAFLALYYMVWSAIAEAGELEGGLHQVMSYLVAGQIVSNAAFIGTEKYIGEKVRKGTIVNQLKRPLTLFKQAYFHESGWALFNFIAKSIPIAVLGIVFLDITTPDLANSFLFIISLFLAYNLVFLLAYSLSMLVFWTKVDWSLRMMRNTTQNLFSGVLFPLYLLPDSLATVFSVLPFQAMADSPIRIFIMEATGLEVLNILIIQMFWILVLYGVSVFAWSKAKKKLTVQGG